MRRLSLSTYILMTVVSLVLASTLTIAGILYLNLSGRLTAEFMDRLKAESSELGLVVGGQIYQVENRLRELSLDNSIRVTLMLGADQQLREHLRKVYTTQPAARFYVKSLTSRHVFSASDGAPPAPILHALSEDASFRNRLYKDDQLGVCFASVIPIYRKNESIGKAACLYQFKEDSDLKGLVGDKLVYYGGDAAWRLFSGRRLPDDLLKSGAVYAAPLFSRQLGALPPVEAAQGPLSHLMHIATLDVLRDGKRQVLLIVLFSTCGVLSLTIVLSYFLSRRISAPLQRLSEMAMAVATSRSDSMQDENGVTIAEVERLRASLNTMLDHLREADQLRRYQELFDGVADPILIHDAGGRILEVNDVALEQFGYARPAFLALKINDLMPVMGNASDVLSLTQRLDKAERHEFEAVIVTRTGKRLIAECHSRKIFFKRRQVILSVLRDITDRKRAEEALKNSEARFRLIVENSHDGIVVIDDAYRFLYVNDEFCRISGRSRHELLDQDFRVLLDEESLAVVDRNYRRRQAGEPAENRYEFNIVRPNGEKRRVEISSSVVRSDGGQVRTIAQTLDVTDQKNMESRLRRAQKMEALGTLAGGVAHDLNNILSGIVSYPELLLLDLPSDSPLRQPIQTIKTTGEKAATIVQDLLTLARRGVAVKELTNLNRIVADYLDSPEFRKLQSFHPSVEMAVRLSPELFNVSGSPVHLSKTVMNLVSNGAEAMPAGGLLTVETFNRYVDRPFGDYDQIDEGDYAVLRVHDTGIGMQPDELNKIFEPFYSKKVMGRSGTGLGMAVVWGTVKDHAGYIDVSSRAHHGTTFTLYFPAEKDQVAAVPQHLSIDHLRSQGETVLVVDDVAEQREIASCILTKLGYRVETAPSGEAALEFLSRQSVDIVVLDMIMAPGMDGLDTYRRMLTLHPSQRAVIASGFSETERVREAQRLGAGDYIKKPYRLDQIGAALKNALHPPPAQTKAFS